MPVNFQQEGRATFQFFGALARYSGTALLPRAARYFEDHADPAVADARIEERLKSDTDLMADCTEYAYNRFFTRLVAEDLYRIGYGLTDDVRPEIEAAMRRTADVGGTLELNPEVDVPRYYGTYPFHLMIDGWDGHDLVGFTMDDAIYPLVFATGGIGTVKPGEKVMDQRQMVARQGRKGSYRRILEPGVGTGRFAEALQKVYPDAEVCGVDLSVASLRYAHHRAAELGFSWELRQASAEQTGYPDASFDLVAFFTLFHEIPVNASTQCVREAFRLLESGGEIIIGDVAPYKGQGRFESVVLFWEKDNRNEPFWHTAARLDRAQVLRDAGFVDVEEYPVTETNSYPWITRGVKP